ncbi:hypothetical protein NLU13_5968 [Sarocladium strictum]|uniref:Mitochondrial ribosomal protein MRP51 n=1 Tax=Sarocladium strictum TaxID=5046 RepID=A0AA39L6B2_SARSR|nr:hypothetical protein NLU13_5968 [Sarocladium strictum]
MSGRAAASPGGQLLRSSRLFSVPKPLPEPQSNSFNIGLHKSLTATKAYPTHQAFTTPRSSRENGDWGFKRPFPLKSTNNTSTPLIRIKQVDTIENVTDFASASDLSLTLEKFQEMRVAPLLPKGVDRSGNPILQRSGVFEEHMDVTYLKRGQGAETKWKFQGPWLARMDEGSFEAYLKKSVRPKRAEFRSVLKKRMVEDKNRTLKTRAMEKGEPAPPEIKEKDITQAEFTEYLRLLRHDRPTLYAIVADFLDLAPLTKPVGGVQTLLQDFPAKNSPFGLTGAPQAHPSAGIGYLRTNSFLENHPVFGPQGHRTPVQARIISPRDGVEPAKLGVGGMVADAPLGNNQFNSRTSQRGGRRVANGITHLDHTTYGGAKAWVEPKGVVVDPSGSVVLQIQDANPEAQLVAEENNNPGAVYHDTKGQGSSLRSQQPQRMGRLTDEILAGSEGEVDPSTVKRTAQWYGL